MVHTTALIIFLFIVQTIIAVPDRLDDKEKGDQSSCVHRDKHTHEKFLHAKTQLKKTQLRT